MLKTISRHSPAIVFFIFLSLFAIQMVIRFTSVINHDNAWYIYIANGILHGKTLYKDFIEPNPPLAIWLTIPFVWLADLFSVRAQTIIFSFFFVITLVSLILCNRYLTLVRRLSSPVRSVLILLLCFVFLFCPGTNFAQREHLIVLLFFPWLMLRFARLENNFSKQTTAVDILVGAMAGLGFCLKPQYLMAPIFIELYILLQSRSFKHLFAPENLAALIILCCYPFVIWVFTPQYFELLPLIAAAYPYFELLSFMACFKDIIFVEIIYVLLIISIRFVTPLSSKLLSFTMAAATGFLIGYFIQSRGFLYHLLPFFSMIAFGLGIVAIELIRRFFPSLRRSLPAMILVSLGGLSFALAVVYFFNMRHQRYPYDSQFIGKYTQQYAPQAQSIYIATVRILGFPYVVQEQKIWGSRSPCEWLVPYIMAKTENQTGPEDPYVSLARDWMVSDLIATKPDLIMVLISPDQVSVPRQYFDYVKFWQEDPRFDQFWKNYTLQSKDKYFAVYSRNIAH